MNLNEFLSGSVSEVMVKDVVSYSSDTRLADVALSLLRNQISGAPIIDEGGKCVGVISVVDVIGAVEKMTAVNPRVADRFFASSDLNLPQNIYDETLQSFGSHASPAVEKPVAKFMVRKLVTATVQDTLGSVIQKMIDAHIHRVLITDADRRLLGIVSTTDILAALLREGQTGAAT